MNDADTDLGPERSTGRTVSSTAPRNGWSATTSPTPPTPAADMPSTPPGTVLVTGGRGSLTRRKGAQLTVLALVLVLLGGAGSYLVALQLPEQYAARTDLLFTITTAEPTGFLREDRTLTTQQLLIEGRSVLGPVADRFGIEIEELSEMVTAEVPETSKIIRIQVVNRSRDTAVQLVEAVATQYQQSILPSENVPAREYLEEQLAQLRASQDILRPERAGALAVRETALLNELDALVFEELNAPRARTVVPAYALATPVSPRPMFAAVTGALTASLLAAFVVAVLARRATRG